MLNKTVSVIGGDLRQLTLAKMLQQEGYTVKIYGFDKHEVENLQIACYAADATESEIIILPLPVSHDSILINAPLSEEKIPLSDIFPKISNNSIVFGGKISGNIRKMCNNSELYDYFEREELSVLNAIPTAEGAIEIALNETPYTLHKSKCLVIGYGRIGKILADRLSAFGAEVTVSARKFSDFAWIKTMGYIPADSNHLHNCINNYQLIFNTVPAVILDGELLKKIPETTTVIDLASKPGGVDFSLAKELGVKVIWALSLPGKVAPVTSGEIIKETILNILKERTGGI